MPQPQGNNKCGNSCFRLCIPATQPAASSTIFVPNACDDEVLDARDLLGSLSAELITVQDYRRESLQVVVQKLTEEFDQLSGAYQKLQDENTSLRQAQRLGTQSSDVRSDERKTDLELLRQENEKLKSEVAVLRVELDQLKQQTTHLKDESNTRISLKFKSGDETNGRAMNNSVDPVAYLKLGDDTNGRLSSMTSRSPNYSPNCSGVYAGASHITSSLPTVESPNAANRRSSGGSSGKSSLSMRFTQQHKVQLVHFFDRTPWKLCQVFTLAFALFGGGIFLLFDTPEDPGTPILDALMVIATLFFIIEIVGQQLVDTNYRFSFFFWMDVLGTVSMMFEISFLLGRLANVDTVVLRTARTAKLGARVGRLLKLLKFLLKKPDQSEISKAKILSQNLLWALSTRVSVLTILLVMILPVFSIPLFPTEDFSLKLWPQRLEDMYNYDITPPTATMFATSITALVDFYKDLDYVPYKIEGYSSAVSSQGIPIGHDGSLEIDGRREPNRETNRMKKEVTSCRLSRGACDGDDKAAVYFDMTTPNQIEAAMNMSLIIFIIVLMVYMTFDLNRIIESMLVEPLERMIHTVRVHASDLCSKFSAAYSDVDSDTDDFHVSEVEMLESVLKKLARLANVHLIKNVVHEADISALDNAGKAILVDMMNVKIIPAVRPTPMLPRGGRASMYRQGIHTWDFNVLDFTNDMMKDVIVHIFFTSELGYADDFVEMDTFLSFHEVVQAGYNDVPYHRFAHACDVLHGVFRLLSLLQSKEWLTPIEQYALLIAALCHDIGHMGTTNQFLVETGHELALRYNDKSPLENMHCAKMYEICSAEKTDAFMKATPDNKKSARKVCIDAILHTDNAHHFQMVQSVSHAYEIHDTACESQAAAGDHLTPDYITEVLTKERQNWIQLFLHLVDVSNPLKPFEISVAWANRVLEEFFAQGDEEKRLGIPVGMLNDRDSVNRPGSQHGFINFLVAPLVAGVVKIFPILKDMHHQMAINLEKWRDIWVEECSPSAEEIAKKDADVQRIKDLDNQLQLRGEVEFD